MNAVTADTQARIAELLKTSADGQGLRALTTTDLESVAKVISSETGVPDSQSLAQVRQVRDALLWEAGKKLGDIGDASARLRKAGQNKKPQFQASASNVPIGPWSHASAESGTKPSIELDGHSLSLDQLHTLLGEAPAMTPSEARSYMRSVTRARNEGAPEPGAIQIGAGGRHNINRSNDLLANNRANPEESIYGIDTGFGAQKDADLDPLLGNMEEFQLRQLLSHNVGLGPELPPSLVRVNVALRANTMASGNLAGNSLGLAQRYTDLLNIGLTPVVKRIGGLGMGDLTTNTAIGLAAIGHPAAELRRPDGTTGPADVVLKEFGVEPAPMQLTPGEGLAIMSGTSTVTAGLIYAEQRVVQMIDKLNTLGDTAGAQQLSAALDEARGYLGVTLKREINAASGSPLAFENADGKLKVLSGGNWSEAMLGVSIDHLNAVMTASMHTIATSPDQRDLLLDMQENAAQSAASALGQITQGGQEDTPTMAMSSLNNLLDQIDIAEQILQESVPSAGGAETFAVSPELVTRSNAVKERYARLSRLFDGAASLYFEADLSLKESFDADTHDSRGIPGQIVSAENINQLRAGSKFMAPVTERVQDAVVHRATPDIHGAVHAANAYMAGRERHDDAFRLTGVFDQLNRVLTQASVASERRLSRLMSAHWSNGLPTYLSGVEGRETGVAQVSAAATAHLTEMRQATGSSLALRGAPQTQRQADKTVESSLGKLEQQLERAEAILASEILTAVQGIDLRIQNGDLTVDDLGEGTRALYEVVRGPPSQWDKPVEEQLANGYLPFIREDRDMGRDLNVILDKVRDGAFDDVLRQVNGG